LGYLYVVYNNLDGTEVKIWNSIREIIETCDDRLNDHLNKVLNNRKKSHIYMQGAEIVILGIILFGNI